ncbi:MAG: hypothetical protein WB611_01155 [Stellaceae bacterium]
MLLEINILVAAIQHAPVTKINDLVALLDVALEHELDLASDIAFYGLSDYPMTARLLRELAKGCRDLNSTHSAGGCRQASWKS